MFDTKKKRARKLELKRETLRKLTTTDLSQVNGGIGVMSDLCGSDNRNGAHKEPCTLVPPEMIG